MLDMYKGIVNSPETTITNNISNSDTLIYVLDPTRVPTELPNLMTLGTTSAAETVRVLSTDGNALSVERGFQGTPAAWNAGTVIARNFTEYDYDALKENVIELDAAKFPKSLATAANQVPVSSGVGAWAVKTLAQFKSWLGLGSAAYADIANNLTTTAAGSVLDASQGKALGDLISTHKAEIAAHAELTDRVITVGPSGKDFTSIQAAVNSIKKRVDAIITINVDAGTYNEDVKIEGFTGKGSISVNGASTLAAASNYQVKSISVIRTGIYVAITGFRATTTAQWVGAFSLLSSMYVSLAKCDSISSGANTHGFVGAFGGYARVEGCTFSNKLYAIASSEGVTTLSIDNAGVANTYGLGATLGGVVAKNGTQPSGTTAEQTWGGGQIR